MKLVVADSSPLVVFARSGLIPILSQVAGEVLVPETLHRHSVVSAAVKAVICGLGP